MSEDQIPDEAVRLAMASRARDLIDLPDPMVLSDERLTRRMLAATLPALLAAERRPAMSGEPQRIQRKRSKGWRLPEGAVIVTRGTRWGNPWREGTNHWTIDPGGFINRSGNVLTRQDAVDSYRNSMLASPEMVEAIRRELARRDLACWCPLPAEGEPDICHAAVLLRIANSEVPGA